MSMFAFLGCAPFLRLGTLRGWVKAKSTEQQPFWAEFLTFPVPLDDLSSCETFLFFLSWEGIMDTRDRRLLHLDAGPCSSTVLFFVFFPWPHGAARTELFGVCFISSPGSCGRYLGFPSETLDPPVQAEGLPRLSFDRFFLGVLGQPPTKMDYRRKQIGHQLILSSEIWRT